MAVAQVFYNDVQQFSMMQIPEIFEEHTINVGHQQPDRGEYGPEIVGNTYPILSGQIVTPRFSMGSVSTNILTTNFPGILILIFSKNIGRDCGNTTASTNKIQKMGCVLSTLTKYIVRPKN